MVRGPAGQLAVSCKSTELKRCSMIEMRYYYYYYLPSFGAERQYSVGLLGSQ